MDTRRDRKRSYQRPQSNASTTENAEPSIYRNYRPRDYGTGYGRSSSYGFERHYTDQEDKALFKLG